MNYAINLCLNTPMSRRNILKSKHLKSSREVYYVHYQSLISMLAENKEKKLNSVFKGQL